MRLYGTKAQRPGTDYTRSINRGLTVAVVHGPERPPPRPGLSHVVACCAVGWGGGSRGREPGPCQAQSRRWRQAWGAPAMPRHPGGPSPPLVSEASRQFLGRTQPAQDRFVPAELGLPLGQAGPPALSGGGWGWSSRVGGAVPRAVRKAGSGALRLQGKSGPAGRPRLLPPPQQVSPDLRSWHSSPPPSHTGSPFHPGPGVTAPPPEGGYGEQMGPRTSSTYPEGFQGTSRACLGEAVGCRGRGGAKPGGLPALRAQPSGGET